ncbi:hypothetical protein E4T50_12603 [Aureobasidium sp. EXF-12298]|nr:hypothetical protein E4T50_12603 [Aureobasidium sp. EXF-12298]KAI4754415.1 hypothetical protein E4T51_12467 [Aureobasidium sp. EXF-12344]KAI4771574.1 hypothetical protein E4T52_13428 [Aureobasidium sp. EXF-3400]
MFAASVLVPTPIHMHATVAAVFDILAIAVLFVFVVFYTSTARDLQSYKWALAAATMLPFAIAMIMSIYVLGWMYNNLPLFETHGHYERLASMVAAALAMWTFSLISLGVYGGLYWRSKSSLPDSVLFTSDPLQSCMDLGEQKTQALSLNTLSPYTPNFSRPVSTFSDISDEQSTSVKFSVRNSVQQFLRHGKGSKNSMKQSESVRSCSTSERRPSDGFETWNVASTSDTAEAADALTALRVAQPHRLETIPGSRPVSPAYPLDGPFPEACEADEEADEVPDSPDFPPFAPSLNRRPSHQQLNQDQTHIHPLFRSDSPLPSPAASPGTIITSSPFAGQIVSPMDAAFGSRSRKGSVLSSRPSSPNHDVTRSASAMSLSRPASSRSIRGLAAQQRPRVVMSPSLGDLRAECDKFVQKPRPTLHKRERSA